MEHVRENLAIVLGLQSGRNLDPRQGLTTLGLDSLMALEFKTRLSATLELQLPGTLAFEHPNINAIADYLEGELFPEARIAAPPVETSLNGGQTADLRHLSEEQIAALLAEKIEAAYRTV